jgi:DNA-binding FrmR family transcriptional regulator
LEYNQQAKNRLKRMEENQDCEKVIHQLSAVSSAISHTIGVIVSENLKIYLLEQMISENKSEDLVNNAVKLLVKSR